MSDPLVDEALALLRQLYVTTRRDAAVILAAWVHFDELTPGQVSEILSHYPSRGRAAAPHTEGASEAEPPPAHAAPDAHGRTDLNDE